MRRTTLLAAALLTGATTLAAVPTAQAHPGKHGQHPGKHDPVRFSTFNASLNRLGAGQLAADLSTPGNQQAANVAETIQRVRPDVLLINEFDYDPAAVDLFRDNYLEVAHNGAAPIDYPYAYVAESNTGVESGFDLDGNGTVGGATARERGNDSWGYGEFEGQYGMVVYSRFPIETDEVRTFQHFRWADMPGALIPTDFYSPEEVAAFPLSSKSHWDVPITIGRRTVHFLVSHPTPPSFDGPEDRNGLRNHDEIRFWADYVGPGRRQARYIYDDEGEYGGIERGEPFVIAGDQNADPLDGDSVDHAIDQLLDHPRIVDPEPASAGGVWAASQGGANDAHRGADALDTADFADTAPGNLRVDYVLPSRGTKVLGSGIFWPAKGEELFRLTGEYDRAVYGPTGLPTSDHRQVWVDVRY